MVRRPFSHRAKGRLMPTYRARVVCRDCAAVLSDVTRTVPPSLGKAPVVEAAQRDSLDAIIASHDTCDRIETECERTD